MGRTEIPGAASARGSRKTTLIVALRARPLLGAPGSVQRPEHCGGPCEQHERITALAQELRLQALPDLYGAVAQSAAKRKDASYADFLEEVLKGERDARRV